MVIRGMCLEDLLRVCEIECDVFSKPWTEVDFRDSISNSHNIYLVVEKQGMIVAYCGLWGVAGEGQINNVAVAQSYRGNGIAKIMLAELIKIGREQGIEAFTLEVRISNIPAIHLYHSLGLKDAGVRKRFYDAPVEDALIMWL